MERTPAHHRASGRSRSHHRVPEGPLCPQCSIRGHLARDCPSAASPATAPKSPFRSALAAPPHAEAASA
eukprot:6797663-Pyramimonas_sp.AAC.1